MRRLLVALGALVALAVGAADAAAHPLGNFTVNQYAQIEVAPEGVAVTYVLDLAEIPTFQARERMDADGNGTIDATEQAAERDQLVADVVPRLALRVDGRAVPLAVDSSALAFPQGQGGLTTTRLDLRLRADGTTLGDAASTIEFTNDYATDRVGWREIVVARAPGAAVLETTAATVDRTDGLRSYPADVLSSPPDMHAATVQARSGDGGIAVEGVRTEGNVAAREAARDDDGFAGLVGRDGELGLLGIVGALGLAAVFGMAHALTPGHGKAMVAAYLAGTRGSARHAFALGATVTITHTAGVFLLGLVTLSLSQLILPETLFPWLTLASGVMVLTIGIYAIRDRLRRWRRTRRPAPVAGGHAHDHGHDHDHGTPAAPAHSHDQSHEHDHGDGHGHGHSHAVGDELSWRSLIALGVSGGLLPCPSALVVLLSAVALHRVAFGMALIVAFSLGLAVVVSGIGLAVIYARRLFQRLPSDRGRFVAILPVASAVLITTLGVVLTVRSLPHVL